MVWLRSAFFWASWIHTYYGRSLWYWRLRHEPKSNYNTHQKWILEVFISSYQTQTHLLVEFGAIQTFIARNIFPLIQSFSLFWTFWDDSVRKHCWIFLIPHFFLATILVENVTICLYVHKNSYWFSIPNFWHKPNLMLINLETWTLNFWK